MQDSDQIYLERIANGEPVSMDIAANLVAKGYIIEDLSINDDDNKDY